jgi:hypothetical protein
MRLSRAEDRRLRDSVQQLAAAQTEMLEQQRRMHAELEALHAAVAESAERQRSIEARLGGLQENLTASEAAAQRGLRVLLDDGPGTRERLVALRASRDYAAAWSDPSPLVSIAIPTYVHWQTLEERAVPSVLAQTYENIEVIVVGDAAGEDVTAAMARIDDPRVRFENLTVRGPYPEDARERWYVAGSGPMNRAMELARGRWIAFLNDDDAMRPDHIEALLDEARRTSAEVVYGKLASHSPDGTSEIMGSFPPSNHGFGWQLAMHHSGLRFFEYELSAAIAGEPGDWHRARRMMLAGVRFAQIDRITVDYYPSTLWQEEG